MQLSKKKINRTLEKQIRQMWLSVLTEIKSEETIKEVMEDLLTEAEQTAAVKRMAIADRKSVV